MDGQSRTPTHAAGGPVVIDAPRGAEPGQPGWFDALYRSADGDASRIPWADGRPNPSLVCWLNAVAPGLIRPGSRAIVVGCGLGDDVAELINRGYDAVGFDVSPTAIDWARRRFPQHAGAFCVADLLGELPRFRNRFELVVEISTIQSLPPASREQAAGAIVSLLGARGVLVAIARGRDETELLENVQGPPWPLTKSELTGLMELHGLKPIAPIDDFTDGETPPVRRLRGTFEHA
jgi:hypothetical protein